jgi:hypothetical protein
MTMMIAYAVFVCLPLAAGHCYKLPGQQGMTETACVRATDSYNALADAKATDETPYLECRYLTPSKWKKLN